MPERAQATAIAPCRVCLAGEDLDWTTGPSILMAVELKIRVSVAPPGPGASGKLSIESVRPSPSRRELPWSRVDQFDGHYLDHVQACVSALREVGQSVEPCEVLVDSEFPAGAGLSSSAAILVSTLAALTAFAGSVPDPWKISQLAFHVEDAILCTGAGQMDFYPCTFGGMMYVDSSSTPPLIERLGFPHDLAVVVVDTRTTRKTGDVIARKRERWKAGEPSFLRYLEATQQAVEAMRALLQAESRDWQAIGQLLTQCHGYLRDHLLVSTELLDRSVDACLAGGGFGAKLTGTGMGGCAVALAPWDAVESIQKRLADLPVTVHPTRAAAAGLSLEQGIGR